MKKTIFYSLIAVFSICLFWIGCEKNYDPIEQRISKPEGATDTPLLSSSTVSENFVPLGIPFPEGTEFQIIGSELRFDLPASHYILGIDENGDFHNSALGGVGGVNCKCTKGSGCHPSKAKGKYGCLMGDDCSTCEKKNLRIIGGNEVELVEVMIIESSSELFVHSFSDLDGKYILPSSFLSSELIQELLTEIEASMIESSSDETKTVFINTYGYILPIEIPSDVDNVSIAIGGGGKVKCKCNIAGKSCPLKKIIVGQYCDANDCTNCSMTETRVVNSEGLEKLLSVSREGSINLRD